MSSVFSQSDKGWNWVCLCDSYYRMHRALRVLWLGNTYLWCYVKMFCFLQWPSCQSQTVGGTRGTCFSLGSLDEQSLGSVYTACSTMMATSPLMKRANSVSISNKSDVLVARRIKQIIFFFLNCKKHPKQLIFHTVCCFQFSWKSSTNCSVQTCLGSSELHLINLEV